MFKEILVSSPTSARRGDHSSRPQAWCWEAVIPKPENIVKCLALSPSIERFIKLFYHWPLLISFRLCFSHWEHVLQRNATVFPQCGNLWLVYLFVYFYLFLKISRMCAMYLDHIYPHALLPPSSHFPQFLSSTCILYLSFWLVSFSSLNPVSVAPILLHEAPSVGAWETYQRQPSKGKRLFLHPQLSTAISLSAKGIRRPCPLHNRSFKSLGLVEGLC